MKTEKRLFSYLLKYKFRVFLGLVATTLMGVIDGSTSLLVKIFMDYINAITAQLNTGNGILNIPIRQSFELFNQEYTLFDFNFAGKNEVFMGVFYISMTYIVIFIVKVTFVYFREILMNTTAQKVLQKFRLDIYSAILKLPIKYFDNNKTGEILSRVTYDVNTLGSTINIFIMLSQSVIYTLIFVPWMFIYNWKLSIFAILVFPGSGMILKFFTKKLKKIGEKMSSNVANYTSFLQEKITNQKVVKTFNNEEYEQNKYAELVEYNYNLSFKATRLIALLKPSNELFSTIGIAGLLLFLGNQLINSEITSGDILAYFVLVSSAYKPIKNLADANSQLQMALVSAKKIFDLFDASKEQELLLPQTEIIPETVESIEFKNVCFAYKENEPVLKNVSFKINRGETIAFVGSSGSGKTTIINLLPRFYDIDSGEILINGINIGAIPVDKLRRLFSMVHQDSLFFSGTVRENILYGNLAASQEDVETFAKVANAGEFIEKLPAKYETQIGERGVQLSGGQRQRLAIARSMIRKPQVLLLDEATSALDTESERLVQDALDKVMHNTTSLVVAHRLSTIKNANRIIVVNKGEIAEIGSHEELLKHGGIYKRLYDLQFQA